MYLVLIGMAWLYVAFMMAVAEATSPIGSVLGAFFTFLLYGVGPVALLLYILNTPARRRAHKLAELNAQSQAQDVPPSPPETASLVTHSPDAGRETTTDPITPVREKP
jgi:hypothetical protein